MVDRSELPGIPLFNEDLDLRAVFEGKKHDVHVMILQDLGHNQGFGVYCIMHELAHALRNPVHKRDGLRAVISMAVPAQKRNFEFHSVPISLLFVRIGQPGALSRDYFVFAHLRVKEDRLAARLVVNRDVLRSTALPVGAVRIEFVAGLLRNLPARVGAFLALVDFAIG